MAFLDSPFVNFYELIGLIGEQLVCDKCCQLLLITDIRCVIRIVEAGVGSAPDMFVAGIVRRAGQRIIIRCR